jgi:hypothetical protein
VAYFLERRLAKHQKKASKDQPSGLTPLSRRGFDRPAPAVLRKHVVEGLDRKSLQGRISLDRQEL